VVKHRATSQLSIRARTALGGVLASSALVVAMPGGMAVASPSTPGHQNGGGGTVEKTSDTTSSSTTSSNPAKTVTSGLSSFLSALPKITPPATKSTADVVTTPSPAKSAPASPKFTYTPAKVNGRPPLGYGCTLTGCAANSAGNSGGNPAPLVRTTEQILDPLFIGPSGPGPLESTPLALVYEIFFGTPNFTTPAAGTNGILVGLLNIPVVASVYDALPNIGIPILKECGVSRAGGPGTGIGSFLPNGLSFDTSPATVAYTCPAAAAK